ncbi:hypothetical protein BDV25DRAFT_145866 [Aspergillus avenaceus]|uniref:Uncharacterized protein n=1 Tax=Aspergillus avenaceus TaxID=36643 RepID=A0A5N6TCW6_ASPAV|nr:hypothetical protein BDV25DRAFT_145866 [Aspergillus avenaceus]
MQELVLVPRASEDSLERPQRGVLSRTWIVLMDPQAPCLQLMLWMHFTSTVLPWLVSKAIGYLRLPKLSSVDSLHHATGGAILICFAALCRYPGVHARTADFTGSDLDRAVRPTSVQLDRASVGVHFPRNYSKFVQL